MAGHQRVDGWVPSTQMVPWQRAFLVRVVEGDMAGQGASSITEAGETGIVAL